MTDDNGAVENGEEEEIETEDAEVSTIYMTKIARIARVKSPSADVKAELRDLVLEARADLAALGVSAERLKDESDMLVLGAVRCFLRWKLAGDANEAEASRTDYMHMREELRRKGAYTDAEAG